MNCTMALRMLDAFIDNELDAATTAEVAEHLESCAGCATLRDQRLAMQSALRASSLRQVAPPELRSAIVRRIRQSLTPLPRSGAPRWWQVLLLGSSTALLGAIGGWWIAQPYEVETLPESAVMRHVASLRPEGPRIDVASSDRHVVRPWFQGRLDFAPMVRDLSAQGFDLLGARLDRIGDKQAVAVVYRLHSHAINVFSWRVVDNPPVPDRELTIRGFNVATWSLSDMNYAAVSDTDSAELRRFTAAYRAQ
jgi:anti-sigma factor (TIGR02949 family)